MTIDKKIETAAKKVLKLAAEELGLNAATDDELLDLAANQDPLVLDIMLGIGRDPTTGKRVLSIRFEEAETTVGASAYAPTLEEALDKIIGSM